MHYWSSFNNQYIPTNTRTHKTRARDALTWVEGNAECLPFEDGTFDLYTIAFGLRNVTNRCVPPLFPFLPLPRGVCCRVCSTTKTPTRRFT